MANEPIELLRNDYMLVTLEADGRIVRQRRLRPPYPDLKTARQVMTAALAVYNRIGRGRKGLLVDLREAPGRNDPAFESLLEEFRIRGLHGFAAQAALMRTAVGKLQAQRHARSDGSDRFVTDSEEVAIKHLLLRLPHSQS